MASVRKLVSAVSADTLATSDIRLVEVTSVLNLWASSVTVTDTIGLFLGKTELLPASTCNVRAAASGLVQIDTDQLIFQMLIGPNVGDIRIPVATLTTSLIYILSVEPFIG
jgi:hypothetical protein